MTAFHHPASAAAHTSEAASAALVATWCSSLVSACGCDKCTSIPSRFRWSAERRRRWRRWRRGSTSRSSLRWRPSRRRCRASRMCRRCTRAFPSRTSRDPSSRSGTPRCGSRWWTSPRCCNPSRTSPSECAAHPGRSSSTAPLHPSLLAKRRRPTRRGSSCRPPGRVERSISRCRRAAAKASVSADPTVGRNVNKRSFRFAQVFHLLLRQWWRVCREKNFHKVHDQRVFVDVYRHQFRSSQSLLVGNCQLVLEGSGNDFCELWKKKFEIFNQLVK